MLCKKLLKRILTILGFEIRRISHHQEENKLALRTSLAQAYSLLKKLNFQPKTVIDVGVAKGTPELYSNFQSSYFLLIEPLKEFEPYLKTILKQYKGTYVLAAAGKRNGEISINVHDYHLEGSSAYQESMGHSADGYKTIVQLIRIDDYLKEKKLLGPYLIKVDVQGAEIDVLEGCTGILNETEVIVLEVSLFEFMKGAPQFFDVVSYMKTKDFVAFDIIPGWNRPLDCALGQIDIVFVKENGQFRKNHSYSTKEQLNSNPN